MPKKDKDRPVVIEPFGASTKSVFDRFVDAFRTPDTELDNFEPVPPNIESGKRIRTIVKRRTKK